MRFSEARQVEEVVGALAPSGTRTILRDLTEVNFRTLAGALPEESKAEFLDHVFQVWSWQSRMALAVLPRAEQENIDFMLLGAKLLDWSLAQLGFPSAERVIIANNRLRWIGVEPGKEPTENVGSNPALAPLAEAFNQTGWLRYPERWTPATTTRHFRDGPSLLVCLQEGRRNLRRVFSRIAMLGPRTEQPFLHSFLQFHVNRLGFLRTSQLATVLFALRHRKPRAGGAHSNLYELAVESFPVGWNG